jgi:hypothetical protein
MAKKNKCVIRLHGAYKEILTAPFDSIKEAKDWIRGCWYGPYTIVNITKRLEALRAEIRAERISTGEILELQGLAKYIDKGDVELLQWAGVLEFENDDICEVGPND